MLNCKGPNGEKPGVMVPIPQYPLYSATLVEYNMHQVPPLVISHHLIWIISGAGFRHLELLCSTVAWVCVCFVNLRLATIWMRRTTGLWMCPSCSALLTKRSLIANRGLWSLSIPAIQPVRTSASMEKPGCLWSCLFTLLSHHSPRITNCPCSFRPSIVAC